VCPPTKLVALARLVLAGITSTGGLPLVPFEPGSRPGLDDGRGIIKVIACGALVLGGTPSVLGELQNFQAGR
jgi:hypothetical protein